MLTTTASGKADMTLWAQRASSMAWPMEKPPPWKFMRTGRFEAEGLGNSVIMLREGSVKNLSVIEPGVLLIVVGMESSRDERGGSGKERFRSSQDNKDA